MHLSHHCPNHVLASIVLRRTVTASARCGIFALHPLTPRQVVLRCPRVASYLLTIDPQLTQRPLTCPPYTTSYRLRLIGLRRRRRRLASSRPLQKAPYHLSQSPILWVRPTRGAKYGLRGLMGGSASTSTCTLDTATTVDPWIGTLEIVPVLTLRTVSRCHHAQTLDSEHGGDAGAAHGGARTTDSHLPHIAQAV